MNFPHHIGLHIAADPNVNEADRVNRWVIYHDGIGIAGIVSMFDLGRLNNEEAAKRSAAEIALLATARAAVREHVVSLWQVRRYIRDHLAKLKVDGTRVVIERNGSRVAVLLRADDYDRLVRSEPEDDNGGAS